MSVYHLTYRPKKVDEIDLPDIRDNLSKILLADKMPQAFLFCGPKGSGKTSAARILAKKINKIDDEDRANFLDIIELDAASNRGIDDVRMLRDQAYLLPAQLAFKVFIIDEAHMLTREAFNALLKILEEPPEHTIFILCTTQPSALPDTIVSRLVRLDFRKGLAEEVERAISRIAQSEGLEIDQTVLALIYRHSEGSFRNASRLLNELVVNYGKKLSSNPEIVSFFNKKSGNYGMEALEADLVIGNIPDVVRKLEEEAQSGVDMAAYTVSCLEYFQKKMITNSNDLNGNLVKWLKLLLEACRQVADSPIAQLPLQLAVVEFSKDLPPFEVSKKTEVSEKKEKVSNNIVQSVGAAAAPVLLESVVDIWQKLLMEVGVVNRSVAAFLKAAKPTSIEGNSLVLEVFYNFHKEKIEDYKNKMLIEACLERFLQSKVELSCKLGIVENKPKIVQVEVSEEAVNTDNNNGQALYDVAKEIFG